MRDLAVGTLIDAAQARIEREREKTRTAKWCRHNATVQRALPELPEDDSVSMGLLYAIATGTTAGGDSGGETGGQTDADAGPSGPVGGATGAGPAPTRPATNADSNGQATGGRIAVDGGTGPSNSAAVGGGDPGRPRSQAGKWLVAAITAGASVLGGAGYAAYDWWTAPREEKPPESTTVITQPGDGSLYQWLEDHGYHMPENQ